MKRIALIFIASVFITTCLVSQSITGLWEITLVTVGDEQMTPVAKWTRFNEDGTYQSGNGWLQNAEGKWVFDEDAQTISMEETNGLKDPFGSFSMEINENSMIWKRMEEGMQVTIHLTRVNKIPKAPADQLVGLWSEINEQEAETGHIFFFRWDRIYREMDQSGKGTGYWHMHGHRPEVTLLSHNEGNAPETWKVEVTDTKLILTGISDSNKDDVRTFLRLHQFPE